MSPPVAPLRTRRLGNAAAGLAGGEGELEGELACEGERGDCEHCIFLL